MTKSRIDRNITKSRIDRNITKSRKLWDLVILLHPCHLRGRRYHQSITKSHTSKKKKFPPQKKIKNFLKFFFNFYKSRLHRLTTIPHFRWGRGADYLLENSTILSLISQLQGVLAKPILSNLKHFFYLDKMSLKYEKG